MSKIYLYTTMNTTVMSANHSRNFPHSNINTRNNMLVACARERKKSWMESTTSYLENLRLLPYNSSILVCDKRNKVRWLCSSYLYLLSHSEPLCPSFPDVMNWISFSQIVVCLCKGYTKWKWKTWHQTWHSTITPYYPNSNIPMVRSES